MKWLERNAAKVAAVVLILCAVLTILAVRSCKLEQVEASSAKLAKGQASAATASGSDAANTVGNRMSSDAATDVITKENGDAINNAQGADQAVSPAVHDAVLASLCRRAAYRGDPKCVQYARP